MVQYHNNLLRLNESHPEVNDLTLEQTINADAATQHTGIGAFTNSISARQRWSYSHYICMTIITHLLEDVELKQKDDVTRELKANRICKSSADLCSLMDVISESVNPFSPHVQKEFLFNITTGKSASAETTASLLNISSTGVSAQNDFIDECVADPSRFEKPIKRQKLRTFDSEGAKVKKKSTDRKIVEMKMERNLFGKLLCVGLEKQIDLRELLRYPLTPIPLSLCHLDGILRSTQKSELMKTLDNIVVSLPPPL